MTEAPPPAPTAQQEMPLAMVRGERLTELPEGLYIPPNALEVFLDAFEGPLDLLLYLIRRQNLDILDLPVAEITDQYLRYIGLMEELKLELASEYLVMAAVLAEIKSRMLLPLPEAEDEEEDPRAELIRRLQEYERFKTAAEQLDALPRLERDAFAFAMDTTDLTVPRPLPKVGLEDLLMALQSMLLRVQFNAAHQIETEQLSVQDRMTGILERIAAEGECAFVRLFHVQEGRLGVAVTLLAILELLQLGLIECSQTEFGGPIRIARRHQPAEELEAHA